MKKVRSQLGVGIIKEGKLNKRIKKLRTDKGWTQTELGDKLGIMKQQVYKYESGENIPPTLKVIKMAKIFKVTIDWLLTGK